MTFSINYIRISNQVGEASEVEAHRICAADSGVGVALTGSIMALMALLKEKVLHPYQSNRLELAFKVHQKAPKL